MGRKAREKTQRAVADRTVYLALALAQAGRRQDAVREAKAAMAIDPAVANDQFTAAVRMPPKPDNLRQFIASLGAGSE
jgi:hypothetical protein